MAHVDIMMLGHFAVDWAYLRWRAGTCAVSGVLTPGVQRALERLEELDKEAKG